MSVYDLVIKYGTSDYIKEIVNLINDNTVYTFPETGLLSFETDGEVTLYGTDGVVEISCEMKPNTEYLIVFTKYALTLGDYMRLRDTESDITEYEKFYPSSSFRMLKTTDTSIDNHQLYFQLDGGNESSEYVRFSVGLYEASQFDNPLTDPLPPDPLPPEEENSTTTYLDDESILNDDTILE